jgi:hypothetical protein
LNQPFIFAVWNDSKAIRPRVFPTRAEALRIELPNADVSFACMMLRASKHPSHANA